MLKLPQKGSQEERFHTDSKAPKGIRITISDRSLRNNNSSRIWWIMKRDEIARQFEVAPNKSVDSSSQSDPKKQIDRAFKIPVRKKQTAFRKGFFNPDGTMNALPYRSLRKKGNYSLHDSSKESTFGKTTEEIEEFYNNIIHRTGRRFVAINPNPTTDQKCPKINEEDDEFVSDSQQKFKRTLELQPRIFSRLRCTPCAESGLSYDIVTGKLHPHPTAIFKRNDSSGVKDLISPTSESNSCLTENSRKAMNTDRRNCSLQIIEALKEVPRPAPIEMTIKSRRKLFEPRLHATSHDFLLGKSPEAIINVHLGVKPSKRVFPHMKKLMTNWPNYPLAKIPRKRVLSEIITASERMNAKAANSTQTRKLKDAKTSNSAETLNQTTKSSDSTETAAICTPGNRRHPQFLSSEKEKMLRRCRVFPY